MAQQCEVCGKKPVMGNSITIRGKAKYLGGVGTKVTGISRRQFKPNLQTVKITTPSGQNKTSRVCTQCIRSGAIAKKIRNAPFKLPTDKRPAEKRPTDQKLVEKKPLEKKPAAAPKVEKKPIAPKVEKK